MQEILNWGFHIKRLREEKGLNKSELARKSGLGHAHISKIESGYYKNPSQQTFERLARGLDITVSELIRIVRGGQLPYRLETPEQILNRLKVSIPPTVAIYDDFPFHAGSPVEPAEYVSVGREMATGKRLEGYTTDGKCLEPQISDGDIIIVNRDGQIDVGDIVACLSNGELHLGRLRKIADELWLENNEGRIKLEDCQVAAPVIEVRRRLK